MLSLILSAALVLPCTAEVETLLSGKAYLLSARCVSTESGVVVALTMANRHVGKNAIEQFHMSINGEVLAVDSPAGWTASQETTPVRGETLVRWQASERARVKRGKVVDGFLVRLGPGRTLFGCHRGVRFTVSGKEEEVPGELRGCLE